MTGRRAGWMAVRGVGATALGGVLAFSLSGCWGGTIGILAASGGGGGGGAVQVIAFALSVDTPADGQSGRVPITMNIQFDPRHTVVLQSAEYSMTGAGGSFQAMTPAQGFPTEVVPESASSAISSTLAAKANDGSIQRFRVDWNSHFDIDQLRDSGAITRPASARTVVRVNIRNESTGQTLTATTGEFFLDQSLVKTVAGGGVGDGIDPSLATMLDPVGVALDADGNLLIADSGNNRLRQITMDPNDATQAVEIRTRIGNGFAGISTGFRPARSTGMATPVAAAVDSAGNIFTAENDPSQTDADRQGVIRYLDAASDLVTNAIVTLVIRPVDIDLDGEDALFVADAGLSNATGIGGIREFDIQGIDPVIDDITGFRDFVGNIVDLDDDQAPDREFGEVAGIEVLRDQNDNRSLLICDLDIDPTDAATTPGVLELFPDAATPFATRIAGGGAVVPAVDSATLEPTAGVGEFATDLQFTEPRSVAGNRFFYYVADKSLNVIVAVRRSDNVVTNVLGGRIDNSQGSPLAVPFVQPADIEVLGAVLYICEASDSSFDPARNAHRVTVIQNPQQSDTAFVKPLVAAGSAKVTSQALGSLSVQMTGTDSNEAGCGNDNNTTTTTGDEFAVAASASVRGQVIGLRDAATEAPLARPEDVVLDRERDFHYVTDTGSRLVAKVNDRNSLMSTVVGTVAPTGVPVDDTERPALSVQLGRPVGLGLNRDGSRLFIANAADTATGGNIVRVTMNVFADETDNTARVIVPNNATDASSVLFTPVAVAHARFGTTGFLFIADAGVLGQSGTPGVPPRILQVDLSALGGGFDSAAVSIVNASGLGVFNFSCDGTPGTRSDEIVFRFLRDLYPVPQSDGSTVLIVAADLLDQFAELGDMVNDGSIQNLITNFESDCYDGVDGGDGDGNVDADDDECAASMREVVLGYTFDASGNLSAVQSLVHGFKRFAFTFDNPNCNCNNPALTSIVDDPSLVVERVAASADLRFIYVSDPCQNVVRFYEIDRSLLFPVLRFGTAVGSDQTGASPFDGLEPLDTALGRPRGIDVTEGDDLYIADVLNNRIRRSWIGDQIRFR